MIEKTISAINGNLKISLPSVLNELTLGQMMELQERPELNDLEAISILSDIPLQQLQNVKNFDDLLEFGPAILSLSSQIKNLYNSDAVPKTITFRVNGVSKTVNVSQNLSVEPAGAFMAAREIISDEINAHINKHGEAEWQANFNPSLKACCQVLGHYFYRKATGNAYDEYNAEEFCNEVKLLRVTEALPIAKHFFTVYPNLSKQKTNFFHRLKPRWKKKPGLNHSKSLNMSTP